jgi:hypothetical protein
LPRLLPRKEERLSHLLVLLYSLVPRRKTGGRSCHKKAQKAQNLSGVLDSYGPNSAKPEKKSSKEISAKGAKYESQGQVRSEAERVAPG